METLRPLLEQTFGAQVEIGAPITVPASAYNPARRQHRSAVLLEMLARQKSATVERQLGVTELDLYTPDLNFVFGEADARAGVSVFSTARLHTPDRDRFVHRAATEAIHELAHTYRLTHCANPLCVMWFSNTLRETDRKGTRFCPAHAQALERALAGPERGAAM